MATFQNIYYKRTTATAKACYMCFRPTTTVLATINTVDFIYTCDTHLTDRGFASLIEPPPEDQAGQSAATAKKVSEDEIRRVKEEWEERQRRKEEKAKEREKGKEEESGKDKEKDAKKPVPSPKPTPPIPTPIPVPGSTAATKPSHQRYSLHRDVWAMRLTEHRKKRQTTAVKEVAPRLPITPRGGVS